MQWAMERDLAHSHPSSTVPSHKLLNVAAAAPKVAMVPRQAAAPATRQVPAALGRRQGRVGRSRSAAGAAVGPVAAGGQHLVVFRELAERHSLAFWAAKYLADKVYGLQSPNTFEAKSRDLAAFVGWFVAFNGDGAIGDWMPRDTQMYLDLLERQGRAPTTINRVLATLRHFARWANEQPGELFGEVGLPTRDIKELAVGEPDCNKLSQTEVHRLFKAADRLVLTETRKNQRPRRNRALFALLYYAGLRVSELVALQLDQYDGQSLRNVRRKGKARTKELYLGAKGSRALDEYLDMERPLDAPPGASGALLLPQATGIREDQRVGRSMTRQAVALVLEHLAEEANKHRSKEQAIYVTPHRVRHTFGAEHRARSGSDTETAAALGHTGLAHVGRYVRRTREERRSIIDDL